MGHILALFSGIREMPRIPVTERIGCAPSARQNPWLPPDRRDGPPSTSRPACNRQSMPGHGTAATERPEHCLLRGLATLFTLILKYIPALFWTDITCASDKPLRAV